jgi:hypothetical protein
MAAVEQPVRGEATMTIQTQFVPRNYDLFAGLDVDKKSMAVSFTDHDQLKQALRLPYSAAVLLSYVRKHFPGQRVAFAYEAGPTGFGLHDELVAGGCACLVVAPAMVPTARGQRVKTNRVDARKLSENLRGGQLRSIHVPPFTYRDLRHLVQLRDTQVNQVTATKCRIKALLLYEGITFTGNGCWSAAVLRELGALPVSRAPYPARHTPFQRSGSMKPHCSLPSSFYFSHTPWRLLLALIVELCLRSQKLSLRSPILPLRSRKNQPPWLALSTSGSKLLASPLLFLLEHPAVPALLPAVHYANSK